jgi:membrane protease YdiL (CAAX protease family)
VLSTYVTTHRAAAAAAGAVSHTPRLLRYLSSIGLEWLLLGLVMAGIYRRREFLRTAFLNRARSLLESIGMGLAVYILGLFAIAIVGSVLYFTPLFHQRNEAVVLALAPHTPLEFVFWFALSLSAGICEELIFRGYLLQQLTALTGRPIVSIIVAALLFGAVHLYEGVASMLPLAALALVFGFVVRFYKGDLRAVIVAHTLQDFLVAVLLLARPYLERYQPHP